MCWKLSFELEFSISITNPQEKILKVSSLFVVLTYKIMIFPEKFNNYCEIAHNLVLWLEFLMSFLLEFEFFP